MTVVVLRGMVSDRLGLRLGFVLGSAGVSCWW